MLLFDTGLGVEYPPFDRLLAPTTRQPLEGALIASRARLTDVKIDAEQPKEPVGLGLASRAGQGRRK